MTKRTFYKTVIQVTVLSEEPFESEDLSEINYAITEGGCSGDVNTILTEKLDGKQIAKELQSQGSDPEFFRVDEDGNDTEDAYGIDGDGDDPPPVSEIASINAATFVVGERLTANHVKYLQPGDKVFWNDPDNGHCSREYTIGSICYQTAGGNLVRITEDNGSVLECPFHELSWVAQD